MAETALGVLKLTMSHQCALEEKKAKGILGCIRLSVASRSREVILDCWVQFWDSQYKKDTELLERA